jgi:hypothetical protein
MKILNNARTAKLKALVYGFGGSGKSTWAYTALNVPEMCPVLALNMAGNPPRVFDSPNIVGVDIESPADVGKIIEALKANKLATLGIDIAPKTIIVDTLTQLNRSIMERLSGVNLATMPAFNKDQMQHYGLTLQYVLGMMFPLLSQWDGHVIITAQQKTSDFSPDNMPSLLGQAVSEVPAYANFVGQMRAFATFTSQEQDALMKQYNTKKLAKGDIYSVLTSKPNLNVPIVKNQYNDEIPNIILNASMNDVLIVNKE